VDGALGGIGTLLKTAVKNLSKSNKTDFCCELVSSCNYTNIIYYPKISIYILFK